jgi:hypothetical protein
MFDTPAVTLRATRPYLWLSPSPFILTITFLLASCGSPSPTSPTNSGPIEEPTKINLFPVGYAVDPRIFVMVTNLGTLPVQLPLAFDTGSSGITINALELFPSDIVTQYGFNFGGGESYIVYDGITITPVQGTRSYGGAGGRTEIGNLGFTQVTFGDERGILTTSVMPVFLYYSVIWNSTGLPADPQPQQGWFGVNSAPDLIIVPGSTEPAGGYPTCSMDTTISCRVVSVFKYLSYGEGINAGFMLSPVGLQDCDISVANSCTPQPILTVGLNSTLEDGFSTLPLICPPTNYVGSADINGYPVCNANIPGATVTISGSASGTLSNETVLFDTGNPAVTLHEPANLSLPSPLPIGAEVRVELTSGFSYTYEAGVSGITSTAVSPSLSTGIGISFFTEHFFFIDFTNNLEGWK